MLKEVDALRSGEDEDEKTKIYPVSMSLVGLVVNRCRPGYSSVLCFSSVQVDLLKEVDALRTGEDEDAGDDVGKDIRDEI